MSLGRIISIGDSHSLYNYAGVREAVIFTKAGCTMHRMARDGVGSLLPSDFVFRPSDLVILSCGDVDCRMHIKKQANLKGRSISDEIDDLCERLDVSMRRFQTKFVENIAISCLVPFNMDSLSRPEWFDKMSAGEAADIRYKMNSKLRSLGFPFIDFATGFSNSDGSIKSHLSDGSVHIDPRETRPVLEAIEAATGMNVRYKKPPFPVHLLFETPIVRFKRALKDIIKIPDRRLWRPTRRILRMFFNLR